jgi:hypothetical protein
MGLTKTLLDESYYQNSKHDVLYDAEYQEFLFEQQENAHQKTQRIHSRGSNQHETRSTHTLHALRKPKNNQR